MDSCAYSPEMAPYIEEMLLDLSEEYLDVCLIPSRVESVAKDGGMIRVVCNRNPLWYRQLCSHFPKTRQRRRKKPQTSIRKEDIVAVAYNLLKNGHSKSKYASFIVDEAQRRLELMESKLIPFNDQF